MFMKKNKSINDPLSLYPAENDLPGDEEEPL